VASKLFVVVGGQFGSEGKGAVTGRICADMHEAGRAVTNVRVGGPNAGHTVLGRCPKGCDLSHRAAGPAGTWAHPWRLRQVPVGAVTDPKSALVIAAGSEIDPEVLAAEIRELEAAGYEAAQRLFVDRSATVLTPTHRMIEKARRLSDRIGSTAKGIGAARVDRIWRTAEIWGDWSAAGEFPSDMLVSDARMLHNLQVTDTAEMLRRVLRVDDHAVVIEGTQGYGLGLHTSNYPHVTSGNCRAVDFLAQAGVSPWQTDAAGWSVDLKVVVCYRPYPIRVAGPSGRLKGETTWDALGLPVEHTTVTQKVRRVGQWDPELAREAWQANGGPRQGVVWVALTMMDSVEPKLAGANQNLRNWTVNQNLRNWTSVQDGTDGELTFDTGSKYLADLGIGVQHLGYVGTGPDTAIVNERMYD